MGIDPERIRVYWSDYCDVRCIKPPDHKVADVSSEEQPLVLLLNEAREEKQMRPGMQMATVREVAAFLQLKESTVCSLVSRGKLPGCKIGKSWRLDIEKIERLFHTDSGGKDRPVGCHENPEEER